MVFLTLALSSANTASALARRHCPRSGILHPSLLVLAIALAALLTAIAAPPAHAHTVFQGRGSLSPFGAMSLASDDEQSYRMGSRLAFGPSAQVSLEAERRGLPADETDHVLMMRSDVRF